MGRSPKPKPPPRPAHRPVTPFLERKGRYRLAAFVAVKNFTRSGAALFAAIKYGERLDINAVSLAARVEIMRKCLPGAVPLICGAKISTNTKDQPNSWEETSWPGTRDGPERTLHDQTQRVWAGDDVAAKCWLENMALAFMIAQIAAYGRQVPAGNRPMFFDSLKGAILLRAGAASDQGEREWALNNIVPAVDEAANLMPE